MDGDVERGRSDLTHDRHDNADGRRAADTGANDAGWSHSSPVAIELSADDDGGSGIDAITYTTDGSDPTSSGTAQVYTTALPLSATTTVRYFATDAVGNASAVRTESVKIDDSAPANAITLSSVSGGAFKDGSIVYYRGSTPGSFTLTNAVSDSGPGGPRRRRPLRWSGQRRNPRTAQADARSPRPVARRAQDGALDDRTGLGKAVPKATSGPGETLVGYGSPGRPQRRGAHGPSDASGGRTCPSCSTARGCNPVRTPLRQRRTLRARDGAGNAGTRRQTITLTR